ncbi:fluconazole resistance protein 1 [Monosporozyma unispora]
MKFFEIYKNTFLTDILEHAELIEFKEQIPQRENNLNLEKKFAVKQSCTSLNSESSLKDSETSVRSITDDPFLVKWNGEDDPENPRNWTTTKKFVLMVLIMLYSCINYMGASVYTPGQEQIQKEFHVGHVTATLNLSMYVLGYGIGPVILAPLSEIAKVGRQQIYIITFFLFTIFQVACATVNNIGGLIVLRFFAGLLCSPALATVGATIVDMFVKRNVTPFISLWSIGCVLAPVIAPLLGACMVVAKNWRWIFWLMTFLSAFCLIFLIILFPETSHATILARRARRLRKQTGDERYYTEQERVDSLVTTKQFLIATFYRPFKMIAQEPIILVFDIYISVTYGILYLFFEAFPLVFIGIYKFTLIEVGLSYMGFCVGCAFGLAILLLFTFKVVNPRRDNGTFTPEVYLILLMLVGWLMPLALFLFGWGASVHWILPIISEAFFIIACFNLFQATFSYFAEGYPDYVASAYAGNSLMRSSFACAFPLFGTAMYNNLAIEGYPIGWGSSLVGFFTIALAITPFILYKYGPALRARSKFTN